MKAPNRPTVSHVCAISLNGPQFRLIAYILSLPLNYLQKANPRHLTLSLNCILLHVCQHLSRHFCDITFCDHPSPLLFKLSALFRNISPVSRSPPPLLWDAAYSLMPAVCQVLATYFPLTPNRSLLQQSGREGGRERQHRLQGTREEEGEEIRQGSTIDLITELKAGTSPFLCR